MDDAAADHADALRRERRTLESKESALQSALSDLARVETALAQREADLQAIQQALSARDADARREGDEATSARFSLQLELDRFKRDCQRLEDDLVRARRDRDDRDDTRRERDAQLDRLHGEIRDLTSQLAAEKQARLNLSEKLDDTQSSLKSANEEANSAKKKLTDLEGRLGKEHRDLLNADKQYRDQLTERNTLLLTIYQYMERILGPDKVQVWKYLVSVYRVLMPSIEERCRRGNQAIHQLRCLPRQSPRPSQGHHSDPAGVRQARQGR